MGEYVVPAALRLAADHDPGGDEIVRAAGCESHERAWAAGFFDGEGCTLSRRGRLSLQVPQTERTTLERFGHAVGGAGRLYGPRSNGQGHRPIWCWTVSARRDVQAVLTLLWPYLCAPKRAQAAAAFAAYRAASTTIRRNGRAATVEERTRAVAAYRAHLRARALEAVSVGACGQRQIQAWVQCDRKTLLEVLASLVASGTLSQGGLGRRGRPYIYGLSASVVQQKPD